MQCVAATPTVEFRPVVGKQSLAVPQSLTVDRSVDVSPYRADPGSYSASPLYDVVAADSLLRLLSGRPFVRLATA